MSASLPVPERAAFFGLTSEQVDAQVVSAGLPAWRGRQLRTWVYDKLVIDPHAATTFSTYDKDRLAAAFEFAPGVIAERQQSADGTIKLLLQWQGDCVAETVMIPDLPRRTACISSQVGCPVGCKFCASGMGGMKGNLTAAQIVEQVHPTRAYFV